MGRLPTIPAYLLATLLATGAAAQESSTAGAQGTVDIHERATIQAAGDVIFDDIALGAETFQPLTAISEASANVTILGDASTVSLAVPEVVSVAHANGADTLTLVTSTEGDTAAISGLDSLIAVGGILSVDVGGSITVSAADLAPGEYRGLLVVVAQYN